MKVLAVYGGVTTGGAGGGGGLRSAEAAVFGPGPRRPTMWKRGSAGSSILQAASSSRITDTTGGMGSGWPSAVPDGTLEVTYSDVKAMPPQMRGPPASLPSTSTWWPSHGGPQPPESV